MNATADTVLLVDDHAAVLRLVGAGIERRIADIRILTAQTKAGALETAAGERPGVAVIDLSIDERVGPPSGFDLLGALHDLDTSMRIIVLTGHGAAEHGVECLQAGAASFLEKPPDLDHLAALVRDGLSCATLKRNYERLRPARGPAALLGLSSRAPVMTAALDEAAYAASNSQPVLILGETGAGKGVLAEAIHRASVRAKRSLIRFQPTYTNTDIVASELFGHVRGAFTGAVDTRRGLIEEADGGTLFIDEVDELPQETQVVLLNVLQNRVYRAVGASRERRSDFRLVSATNRPRDQLVRSGKLREDFFHRIAHITIELPPLRERADDIDDLASLFLRGLAGREKLTIHGFSPDAATKLRRHRWPGNVRELQAVVESAVHRAAYSRRHTVEPMDVRIGAGAETHPAATFREQVDAFERKLIEDALLRSGNNQSQAATDLGLDRTTLRRILQRADKVPGR